MTLDQAIEAGTLAKALGELDMVSDDLKRLGADAEDVGFGFEQEVCESGSSGVGDTIELPQPMLVAIADFAMGLIERRLAELGVSVD